MDRPQRLEREVGVRAASGAPRDGPGGLERRTLLVGALGGALLTILLMALGAALALQMMEAGGVADLCSRASSDPSRLLLGMSGAASCNLVQPLFSPGSKEALVAMIRSARTSIDVEMYVFTDADLARELGEAAGRGVRVRVILEPRVDSSGLDGLAQAMQSAGVQLRWANVRYALTHTKMMIIDGKRALVGSINFSKSAQNKNREAALEVAGPVLDPLNGLFETDWADASERRTQDA